LSNADIGFKQIATRTGYSSPSTLSRALGRSSLIANGHRVKCCCVEQNANQAQKKFPHHGELNEHTLHQDHHSGWLVRMFLNLSGRRLWCHAFFRLGRFRRLVGVGKKVRTELSLRLFGGALHLSSYGAKNDPFFGRPVNATGWRSSGLEKPFLQRSINHGSELRASSSDSI
jgi:hypothetical protein